MTFKILFFLLLFFISLLFLTSEAGAEPLPWSSIQYKASAKAVVKELDGTIAMEDYQEIIGPPLPAAASAYVTTYDDYEASGSSQVDSSSIYANTWAHACGWVIYIGEAWGGLEGTYISTLPVFEFSYVYSINSNDYQDLWLKVVDLTNVEELFFQTLESGSNALYINTPLGHEIRVELSTYAKSFADGEDEYSSSSFSFTYEMAEISEIPQCLSPVRIAGATPIYYSSLQSAYIDAVNGDIIQSQAEEFNEDLYIDEDKSVTLEGGYDCYYSSITGNTVLKGTFAISDGAAIIENFIVQ